MIFNLTFFIILWYDISGTFIKKEGNIMRKTAKKGVSVIIALIMLLGSLQFSAAAAVGKDITASFTDPNFLAAVREITGKPTGPIYSGDVKSIETLSLTGRMISSLSGIEHFTVLKYLDCAHAQLIKLDVSKNTTLEYLDCGYNYYLTELDVSKNTALEYLCCYSGQLTELDVSNNIVLRELICNYNQLTKLDISYNTALRYLACDGNQLTKLDVSNNIALEYLACHDNQLTELDVSKNIALE